MTVLLRNGMESIKLELEDTLVIMTGIQFNGVAMCAREEHSSQAAARSRYDEVVIIAVADYGFRVEFTTI